MLVQVDLTIHVQRDQHKGETGQRLEKVKILIVKLILMKEKNNMSILLMVLNNKLFHAVHGPKHIDFLLIFNSKVRLYFPLYPLSGLTFVLDPACTYV